MVFPRRGPILLGVLLALPAADAAAQSALEKACIAEIRNVEKSIAQARERPEFRNEEGRRVLSTADRWVYQARKHAVKSESRSCVTAAQKASAQFSAR